MSNKCSANLQSRECQVNPLPTELQPQFLFHFLKIDWNQGEKYILELSKSLKENLLFAKLLQMSILE